MEFKWTVVFVLIAAGIIGSLASLPLAYDPIYTNAGPHSSEENDGAAPTTLSFAVETAVNLVLISVLVWIGVLLMVRVGLQAPLIHAWCSGRRPEDLTRILVRGISIGLATGIVIGALAFCFYSLLPKEFAGQSLKFLDASLWKRLLAGLLYGGIVEELVFRLFCLSLVAWLLGLVWQAPDGRPATGAFWVACCVAALLFAAIHLPAAALLHPLTPAVVACILSLNGLCGLIFGMLYCTDGLESAMLAHASMHLVLQMPLAWLARTVF